MKIFMIDPSAFSYPYDYALCNALAQEGHDVCLFTRPERTLGELPNGVFKKIAFYYRFSSCLARLGTPSWGILSVKAIEHVFDMIRLVLRTFFERPDVVHFQWTPVPVFDRFIVKLIRVLRPVILTVHDVKFLHGAPTSRLQLFGWRKSLDEYSDLLVHTESASDELEQLGVRSGRPHVVPHGPLMLRGFERHYSHHKENRVLFFGNIKPYKGIDLLLKAWALLPKSLRREWKLTIAGNGPSLVSEYQQLSQSLGLAGEVEWLDRFLDEEEISDLLGRSEVVVFPYREIDASGAFEATLPFKPVILASRVGIFAESIVHLKNGFLFEPNDIKGLHDGLVSLLSYSDLRTRLRYQISHLASGRPQWSEISRQTSLIYRHQI